MNYNSGNNENEIENKNEILIEDKIKNKIWQKCLGCGVLIEKIDGCNFIECLYILKIENNIATKCSTKWCWICYKIKGNNENQCQWNHPSHNSH